MWMNPVKEKWQGRISFVFLNESMSVSYGYPGRFQIGKGGRFGEESLERAGLCCPTEWEFQNPRRQSKRRGWEKHHKMIEARPLAGRVASEKAPQWIKNKNDQYGIPTSNNTLSITWFCYVQLSSIHGCLVKGSIRGGMSIAVSGNNGRSEIKEQL